MRRSPRSLAIVLAAASLWSCDDGGGGSTDPVEAPGGGDSTPTVYVKMHPSEATLAPLGKMKFYATVFGLDDNSVTWEVDGGSANGTITDSGLYTAPLSVGIFKVRARSVENPSVSGVAEVVVGYSAAINEIDDITGTVQILIDDDMSYEIDGYYPHIYEAWKQDVTYSYFRLYGPIWTSMGYYYWNTHRGETVTVKGSFSHRTDKSSASGKLLQRDERVAKMQTLTLEHYIQFRADTATNTGVLDVDGVSLDGLMNWHDYESGDYEEDTPGPEETFGFTVTGIPLSMTPLGHLTGSKDCSVKVYTDPDRFIKATVKWDLDLRPL